MCFRSSCHGMHKLVGIRNVLTLEMIFLFDTLNKVNERGQEQGSGSKFILGCNGTYWFKGNRKGKLYIIGSSC